MDLQQRIREKGRAIGRERRRGTMELGRDLIVHREEKEVTAVVVVLGDHQLLQLGVLDLEGVATVVKERSDLFQLPFSPNAII